MKKVFMGSDLLIHRCLSRVYPSDLFHDIEWVFLKSGWGSNRKCGPVCDEMQTCVHSIADRSTIKCTQVHFSESRLKDGHVLII